MLQRGAQPIRFMAASGRHHRRALRRSRWSAPTRRTTSTSTMASPAPECGSHPSRSAGPSCSPTSSRTAETANLSPTCATHSARPSSPVRNDASHDRIDLSRAEKEFSDRLAPSDRLFGRIRGNGKKMHRADRHRRVAGPNLSELALDLIRVSIPPLTHGSVRYWKSRNARSLPWFALP